MKNYYHVLYFQAEAAIVAHVKATEKVIKYMEDCDKKQNSNSDDCSISNSATYKNDDSNKKKKSGSYAGYSNMDISNNSNMSANDFTSESDKMSSSMEMDTSFNWLQ